MQLTTTDVFRPDTISPLDADALADCEADWDMTGRLPHLIRGAAHSRRLADLHKRAARSHLRAARAARELCDAMIHRDHMTDGSSALRRASACVVYARRCEREAHAIAIASGFLW